MAEENIPEKQITKNNSRNYVVYGSIIMFIFGGVVIALFSPPIIQAHQWEENPTCDDLLICKTEKNTFSYIRTVGNGSEVIDETNNTVKFSSRGVFAVNNKIDYEIIIDGQIKTIEKIYLLFLTDKEFSQIETIQDYEVLHKKQWQSKLIEIPSTKTGFYLKDVWETPSIPSDIYVIGYAIRYDQSVTTIMKSDVVFSTVSQEIKVQDTTNQEARITNKIVLGLTGVGIGLAFWLLGADFLVRVYFR